VRHPRGAASLVSGPVSAQQGRRRRWLLATIVVAITAVGTTAVVVRLTVFRDRSRAVSLDQARARFRDAVGPTSTTTRRSAAPSAQIAQPAPTSPPTTVSRPSLVAPGVYRYRTTGEESVDVLSGATHPYPDETTITVTPDGCGVVLRWDALKERRDEWRLCNDQSGIELQPRGLQYHEFFGSADAEDVVCDRTVVFVPSVPSSGPTPVHQECTLAADPWLPTWEVFGVTQHTVGQDTIDVRHVRMVVDDQDDYWEHTVVDWYVAEDGLPVEVSAVKESRSPSPVGAVVYREQYRLDLVSRAPLT
jgi:hypothetical protein